MRGFDPADPLAWLALADWLEEQDSVAAGLVRDLNLKMVYISPGTFLMGSLPGGERFEDERPQHEVEITRSFYLGVYQITQAQWHAVMGNNPSFFRGDNLPVGRVSWEDCQMFCEKLLHITGTHFRLPTEAEWEYACRAGTTTAYSTGDTEKDLARAGWYKANSNGQTHLVGEKEPNAWGLYDMHGNVYEWCQDWYRADYYKSSPQQDPPGSAVGSSRVIRGGSWFNDGWFCRSAFRYWNSPGYRDCYVGFRVAADLPG